MPSLNLTEGGPGPSDAKPSTSAAANRLKTGHYSPQAVLDTSSTYVPRCGTREKGG